MTATYALLLSRVKAFVIDQLIVIGAMYGVSELFALFDGIPDVLRKGSFLLIFVIYEPLFVSMFGATIGHSYSKISVKSEKDMTKNIIFPLALLRYVVKLLLGWISLLTVTSNEKKKALHDMLVKSVVLENSIDG